MKIVHAFSVFFAFCILVTLAGEISSQDIDRGNITKLSFANNEFAFNLHRRLASGSSKNVFFSPFSISTLFGMLFYGTRGNTAEELRQVLGYERANFTNDLIHRTFSRYLRDVIQHDNSSGCVLNIANAVLVGKSIRLLEEYKRNIQKMYRASVRDVDFRREGPKIVEEINNYVKENTNGKINKVLQELDPSNNLILLNVVYFDGKWKTPFKAIHTRDDFFYNNGLESKRRKVPMMNLISFLPHASIDNFQALELPYKGENACMLILLPNKRDGLQDLEESLTPEKLGEIHRRLKRTTVDVLLPKFQLQFEKELSPEIQIIGGNEIFRIESADFSGMASKRNIAVSQVLHKSLIEVNELGSAAAAATISGRRKSKTIYIKKPIQFKVNHPFLFAILENSSSCNMILFLGRVNHL